jgi:magnesium chelatase family protein
LLDRIDLVADMPRPSPQELLGPPGEASAAVRARVLEVRRRSLARQGCANGMLDGEMLDRHCTLDPKSRVLLQRATETLGLSARAHARVRRVARTIADAGGCVDIELRHLAEALAARGLDDEDRARCALRV